MAVEGVVVDMEEAIGGEVEEGLVVDVVVTRGLLAVRGDSISNSVELRQGEVDS